MNIDEERVNILCLSGGGFRGLYSAAVLDKFFVGFEKKKPIKDCFNLIIGTSTGGLVGAAAACGVPTSRIVSAFIKHGPRIFPKGKYLQKAYSYCMSGAKYSNEPLIEAIDELIPDYSEKSIQETDLDLALVSSSIITNTHRVFAGSCFSDDALDRVTVKQAILSTTAAPALFVPQKLANDVLIDGGVSANAPVLIGRSLLEKLSRMDGKKRDVHVLHIGTATPPHQGQPHGIPSVCSGIRLPHYLSQLFISTQEAVALDIANSWIGEKNYTYVNAPASFCHSPELRKLDNASDSAKRQLLLLAEHSWLQWKDSEKLKVFFNPPS